MSNNLISSVKKIISTNKRIDHKMANVCYAIIDHVSNAPEKKQHLTFADLYRVSPKVDSETFYDAVFLLTGEKYNILTQNFEALDPFLEFKFVEDREQIIEDMRNAEYFNPFTGEQLTEEEFGEQVLIFFSPSSAVMEACHYE